MLPERERRPGDEAPQEHQDHRADGLGVPQDSGTAAAPYQGSDAPARATGQVGAALNPVSAGEPITPVIVDPEFEALVPALSVEEHAQLEANVLAHGILDSLKTWNGILVDGHHRYRLAQKHDLPYAVESLDFDDRAAARNWIIRNQLGRRNLAPYARADLALLLEAELEAQAHDRKRAAGGDKRSPEAQESLPQNSAGAVGDTRDQVAKAAGLSRDTIARVKKIKAACAQGLVDGKTEDRLRSGETTINRVYSSLRPAQAPAGKSTRGRQKRKRRGWGYIDAPPGPFDVIVIDPPWPPVEGEDNDRPDRHKFADANILKGALDGLKLPCARSCHVWLWTTVEYLPVAVDLLRTWKVKYVCALVWRKPNGFQPAGLPIQGFELALYARRGAVNFTDTDGLTDIIEGPGGEHGEKPEAFYDMVRRSTDGARLDLFSRSEKEGFSGPPAGPSASSKAFNTEDVLVPDEEESE